MGDIDVDSKDSDPGATARVRVRGPLICMWNLGLHLHFGSVIMPLLTTQQASTRLGAGVQPPKSHRER